MITESFTPKEFIGLTINIANEPHVGWTSALILMLIISTDCDTGTKIVDFTGLDANNVSSYAFRLRKAGLITSKPYPRDKRVRIYKPTKKALSLMNNKKQQG